MEEFNFDAFDSYTKIVVIGVGGAGSNAVNRMIEDHIANIDFWVCNTDAQALATSKAAHKFVLGNELTGGLGAGGDPKVGHDAAEASSEDIKEIVEGANIVFVAAGMGGGTGTGAAPVISRIAREAGALTIAVITRPFNFEGKKRKINAVQGINDLKENVDAYIIVSNDKVMFANGSNGFVQSFKEADKVLSQSVRTITDLITIPGLINLDFNDIKNTLKDKGITLIGYGSGKGENKAQEAAAAALCTPFCEVAINGAKSAIVNITVGKETTNYDVQETINYISNSMCGDKDIIFGVQQNDELDDEIFVAVVATDIDEELINEESPLIRKPVLEQEDEEDEEDNILPNFLSKEDLK